MNRQTNSRHDNINKESPPHSRIFVVCDRRLTETDLTSSFEVFGTIEDLYMPKDRDTGLSKGVAYIKYKKTSAAANAIREMHLKTLNNETKLMKVMVAANKNESNHSTSEDRFTRLFIKVPKEATESDIKSHFDLFGNVESVFILKDKLTDKSKGVAYVNYKSFVDSAKAFEECDRKYKAVFAEPREELKRSRNSLDSNIMPYAQFGTHERHIEPFSDTRFNNDFTPLLAAKPLGYNSLIVNCSPQVSQKHLQQLFNVIPGMVQFQYSLDAYNGFCKATVTYQEERAAAYAVERLNNFEFPSGELVLVKPNSNPLAKAADNLTDIINSFKNGSNSSNPDLSTLVEAIAQASNLIKVAASKSDMSDGQTNCNDMVEPMASPDSEVAMRLFIVCKPQMPPESTLKAVFRKFGDLIKVCTFPNKIFGFVSYASTSSAQQAIKEINDSIIAGVRFKVMEANEKPTTGEGMEMEEEHDIERKKMRLQKTSDN